MRNVAVRNVVQEMPPLVRNINGPRCALYVEIHLMGLERSMFQDDLVHGRYDRYFHAARMETIYRIMNLVAVRSMN